MAPIYEKQTKNDMDVLIDLQAIDPGITEVQSGGDYLAFKTTTNLNQTQIDAILNYSPFVLMEINPQDQDTF
jgi:hypothetical protein